MISDRELLERCRKLRNYPPSLGDRILARDFGAQISLGKPCYMRMLGLVASCRKPHEGPCAPLGFGSPRWHSTMFLRDGRFLLYLAHIPKSNDLGVDGLTEEAERLGFETDIDEIAGTAIVSHLGSDYSVVSIFRLEDVLGDWRVR